MIRYFENGLTHVYILDTETSYAGLKRLYFLMEVHLQRVKLTEIRANVSEKF